MPFHNCFISQQQYEVLHDEDDDYEEDNKDDDLGDNNADSNGNYDHDLGDVTNRLVSANL